MSQLTIKDIAREAGVSVATVSRVINGTGNVNETIKKRVQQVIEENGFKPNFSAKTLKSKKTFAVGLIVSDISDRYYSLMTKAIADSIPSMDYSLIVCSTDGRKDRESWYYDFLSSKHVDGIILNTAGGLDRDICELSKSIPIVLVNRRVDFTADSGLQIDFVGSDDFGGAKAMTNHLLQNGHQKIGIIGGGFSVSSGRDRFRGFQSAMQAAGIEVDAAYPYRYDGKYDIETGYYGLKYLMSKSQVPTAIVTMNDSITLGSLKYCREQKIDIPGDLSVVAYGDTDNAELFVVTPTCISLNPDVIGKRAAQCLFERINTTIQNTREIIFTSLLQYGNSTRPL
ncbi:MAG: LacI family DNA-binding transcriptional regulator [Oscillospiraceae bacterium]|nr:LacI family DNA-binding transcriptional regulator [Oscillospiraceae bacterium]